LVGLAWNEPLSGRGHDLLREPAIARCVPNAIASLEWRRFEVSHLMLNDVAERRPEREARREPASLAGRPSARATG
jgi:hypothetical protein